MPYKIIHKKGKYYVKKKSTGKTVATTDSYKNLKGILWHRSHGE